VEIAGLSVLASRISYVGELGWELHLPIEQGGKLWDRSGRPAPARAGPVGIGVYGHHGVWKRATARSATS